MILSADMVRAELQAMGVYEKIDIEQMNRCFNSQIQSRELDAVLDVISRRKATSDINKAMDELKNSDDSDPSKKIEIAERIAQLTKERSQTQQSKILGADDWFHEIDTIEQMPESVSTGFPLLDLSLGGGLTTGGYHLVASPTGSGKTILMLTMWKHLLDTGVPCVYINYEISRQVFMKFLFAQFTGVNVMRPNIDPVILAKAKIDFKAQVVDLLDRGLLLLADPMQGASKMWEDIEDMIRGLVEDHGAKAIFFDTINSVYASTKKGQDQRWNEYEKIAMAAERMNIELNVATVFSVQMDKESQKNRKQNPDEDKTPKLQDVAGSKTLTEKAVSVIHLHRSDLYDQTRRIDYSEIHVTKNRLLGQEMGRRPIRVMYDVRYKSLKEMPVEMQEVERDIYADQTGAFPTPKAVTGVTRHPNLQINVNDGKEL